MVIWGKTDHKLTPGLKWGWSLFQSYTRTIENNSLLGFLASKILNSPCSTLTHTHSFSVFNAYVPLSSNSEQFPSLFPEPSIPQSWSFHFPHDCLKIHESTLDAELCQRCFLNPNFHSGMCIFAQSHFSALPGYFTQPFDFREEVPVVLRCLLYQYVWFKWGLWGFLVGSRDFLLLGCLNWGLKYGSTGKQHHDECTNINNLVINKVKVLNNSINLHFTTIFWSPYKKGTYLMTVRMHY